MEGCPILRQIYAWHCIVLTSDNNTCQTDEPITRGGGGGRGGGLITGILR